MKNWYGVLFFLFSISSSAQVFKCLDASGKTSYSDKPCNNTSIEKVISSDVSPLGGKPKDLTAVAADSKLRSGSSIRATMDKSKGRMYAQYNSRLKTKPELEGKVIFQISIAPSGQVSSCSTSENSTLNDQYFRDSLCATILQLDFGGIESDVDTTLTYSMDFLSS